MRHEAARALGRSRRAPADVPRLVAALDSADDYVAAFAAWSLGNLGGRGARGRCPALARALARERTDAVVAGALARIGPAAADAVPALVEALRSANADRRWRAARTLGRIGPAGGRGRAAARGRRSATRAPWCGSTPRARSAASGRAARASAAAPCSVRRAIPTRPCAARRGRRSTGCAERPPGGCAAGSGSQGRVVPFARI